MYPLLLSAFLRRCPLEATVRVWCNGEKNDRLTIFTVLCITRPGAGVCNNARLSSQMLTLLNRAAVNGRRLLSLPHL